MNEEKERKIHAREFKQTQERIKKEGPNIILTHDELATILVEIILQQERSKSL